MRKNQTLLYGKSCEACIFATETDMPSGLIENYLWCESKFRLTKPKFGCVCKRFIPKRKYKGKVHFVYGW